MQVLKPISIPLGSAIVSASNITELDAVVDPAAWNAATNYATGTLASRTTTTHMIYKRLTPGGVDATLPENDTTKWKPMYPVNKWRPFDARVGSVTTKSGGGAQQITYTLLPGVAINSLFFTELNASTVQVVFKSTPGGTIVYNETVNLDETELLDWYMYFFEPFSRRTTALFEDIPPFPGGELLITISGTTSVGVGSIIPGTMYTIGSVGYGVTAGIRTYSRPAEDAEAGTTALEIRTSAKLMNARFKLNETQVNFVHRLLEGLLDVPAVWIGDNGAGLEPLQIYGYYRDFKLELPTPKYSYYSLEVEGLV